MRERTSLRAFSIQTLTLAVLASTMGCAQLLESGTGLPPAGTRAPGSVIPGRTAASPFVGHRPNTDTKSTYQIAPTRFAARGLGQPHSMAQGLFGGLSPTVVCQGFLRGSTRVLAAPGTLPPTPFFEAGPFDFWLEVNGAPLQDVFTLDAEALSDRAFRSGSFLAARGPQCNHSVFLSVTLRRNRSTSTLVLR